MNFVIDSYVVIIPTLVAWIIFTTLLQLRGRFVPSFLRYIVLTAFVVYVLALIHLTVFPIHVHTGEAKQHAIFRESRNFVPFDELRPLDFVLNIVMTVPLGIFLPVIFRRLYSRIQIIGIGLAAGMTFELCQFVLRETVANDRFVDVNDVIANASGVVLGCAICRIGMQSTSLRKWVGDELLH